MDEALFEELKESLRQAGAIVRGEMAPGRTFHVDQPDVQTIRQQLDLSQARFAALLGISVDTLQNWEQGRRTPRGPAQVLLRIAATHPEAIIEANAS